MKIRSATIHDVNSVARMHTIAFPNFFLTSLGESFLRELYSGFLGSPDAIFLVADEGNELIGFAAGTSNPDAFFLELRQRRGLYFLVKAIPSILHNPSIVIKKLYMALFYRGDRPTALKKGALLSSIGVIPGVVGRSVGGRLLREFEKTVCARGTEFVYLTTDEIGNDRVNAFYRKNGYREESRFIQQKNRPMLRYVKELIRQVNHRSEG